MAAKIAMPLAYPDEVARERVLRRLADTPEMALVSIVAPAGYGKTTLLRQWADRTSDATYVRIDRGDDDPIRLLSAIAAAVDRIEPIDPGVERLLLSTAHALSANILPQFADALWQVRGPILLMLDDVHTIVDRTTLDALAWLALRLPPTVRLAVASRTRPGLPLARWRTEGRLIEVGPDDLALRGHRGPGGLDRGLAGGDVPRHHGTTRSAANDECAVATAR
jgi:LuxR family maltose regulon positive regulatory protein